MGLHVNMTIHFSKFTV